MSLRSNICEIGGLSAQLASVRTDLFWVDTSISQSALEEALLSNIQHGRMSTLSQLRSRYL
jgi:hypothetical protein